MGKKVRVKFKVTIKTVEDENYDFKIQKCIGILLERLIEKEHNS